MPTEIVPCKYCFGTGWMSIILKPRSVGISTFTEAAKAMSKLPCKYCDNYVRQRLG